MNTKTEKTEPLKPDENRSVGWTARVVEMFLGGNLAAMLAVVSLGLGAFALYMTPREEEPQIIVPMVDVHVAAPGLSAKQVERQIATRLEKLLYQIEGVEYVYSTSQSGGLVATARFYVGEDRESSLLKLYDKLHSNADYVPSDVSGWVVKPMEIDDVPIVIVSLWSPDEERHDDYELRRLAEEIEIELQSIPNSNKVYVAGGRPRTMRVEFRAQALAARKVSALELAGAIGMSNIQMSAGGFDSENQAFLVEAGSFIGGAEELRNLVIAVIDGTPVYLKEVAEVIDGPDEVDAYTWIGFGQGSEHAGLHEEKAKTVFPAVHLAVAKKRGTNAVWVARAVKERMAEIAADRLPDGVEYSITRNYGQTANNKVNELVQGLTVAIIIVVALIAIVLGWKEGIVVALAVPITFSLTLFINYMLGYTINRVTLFALTLSLGLVVDDPIINVENIYRHFLMAKEKPFKAVLTAVNEVLPPNVLASLTVIISFIPLFFITGMMGPYMGPMALNVPLSLIMSLIVAFTVTPWMSYHILKGAHGKNEEPYVLEKTATYRIYSKIMAPFTRSKGAILAMLAGTVLLFAIAGLLGALRMVPLKMLPFDNKNEFQVVIDTPEGSTLEQTDSAARAVAEYLRGLPETESAMVFSGTASPMDFNGMVRQYYMRRGKNVADIRINLIDKLDRVHQSHEIVLRIRDDIQAIAERWGANVKLVESPPGPPVVATVVAEVYGDADTPYQTLRDTADIVAARLGQEPMLADLDVAHTADQTEWFFDVDQEKAALSGVSVEDVARTVRMALSGMSPARIQDPNEAHPLRIVLRMPRDQRSSVEELKTLYVKGRPGVAQVREGSGLRAAPAPMVQLGEIGEFRRRIEDKPIFHKNLRRVAYVFGEMAGRAPAEAIVDTMVDYRGSVGPLKAADRSQETSGPASGARRVEDYVNIGAGPVRPLSERTYLSPGGDIPWSTPRGTQIVWNGEGEWKITLDVFRDLGLAFGAACVGIYLLLVFQTGSYFMPLILMLSIPLTIIGIMPGFWLLSALGGEDIGAYPNPTFFTATAMIGMIALAGIAVRNAILLIEFVQEALKKNQPLREALIEAGAVRFRPIFMTAATAMLAAVPITLDPIFSGLAWALIFGLFISTGFTLVVVPATYYLFYGGKDEGAAEAPQKT